MAGATFAGAESYRQQGRVGVEQEVLSCVDDRILLQEVLPPNVLTVHPRMRQTAAYEGEANARRAASSHATGPTRVIPPILPAFCLDTMSHSACLRFGAYLNTYAPVAPRFL